MGLASVLQKEMGKDQSLSSTCVADLWQQNLANHLLWYITSSKRGVCLSSYYASPWSLASMNGRINNTPRDLRPAALDMQVLMPGVLSGNAVSTPALRNRTRPRLATDTFDVFPLTAALPSSSLMVRGRLRKAR
jgi:hypothetical protein